MTKNQLLICIGAIVETLAEVDGAPESMIWLGLQSQIGTLDQFQNVMELMRENKLIKIKGHYVTLEPKGLDLVNKMKEARK